MFNFLSLNLNGLVCSFLQSVAILKIFILHPVQLWRYKNTIAFYRVCSLKKSKETLKTYGFVEVFSGDGWVSRCVRANGIPTASFDIRLSQQVEGKQNAMDILSDAGFSFSSWICLLFSVFFLKHHVVLLEGNDFRKICFRRPPKMFRLLSLTNYPSPGNKLRLILLAILNCKFDNFLALFGLVCSSFVTISKGSHWRYPHDPLGRPGVKFVDDGNHMTAKTLDSILAWYHFGPFFEMLCVQLEPPCWWRWTNI